MKTVINAPTLLSSVAGKIIGGIEKGVEDVETGVKDIKDAIKAEFGEGVEIPSATEEMCNALCQADLSFHKLLELLKAIGNISIPEQIYIVNLLIKKAIKGDKDIVVDDRKVPFERLMQVLAVVPKSVSDRVTSPLIQGFWDDLQRPPHHWPAVPFRSADGSGNSHLFPHIGKSSTSYARSVTPSQYVPLGDRPDPKALFNDLMKRPENAAFEPHPTNINSFLFGLAGVITHDLFRSDPINPALNRTTHYADLSPLYGVDKHEQDRVRAFDKGLLNPDTFADTRLQFQLPSIVAMLLLFSRNHNYIAKQLLEVADKVENYRFTRINGEHSSLLPPEKTDELVFQTARLINGACYANLILHEYLRTILGIDATSPFTLDPLMTPPEPNPTSGNMVSVEFAYIYRWHSAISKEDEKWLDDTQIVEKYIAIKEKFMNRAQEEQKNVPSDASSYRKSGADYDQIVRELLASMGYTEEEIALGPVCLDLHRDPKTRAFPDSDVINVIRGAMTSIASRMGARKVPKALEMVEVQGIEAARKVDACSLNDLRRFFHLKAYKSYEEMLTSPHRKADPEVVKMLEKHYGKDGIEKVEMFPGCVIEAAKDDGLSLPYTSSRAILADATNLLRNDRFYTYGINPHTLTFWGFDYATKGSDKESHGSVFKKMVLNCFPTWEKEIGDPEKADKMLTSPFKIQK